MFLLPCEIGITNILNQSFFFSYLSAYCITLRFFLFFFALANTANQTNISQYVFLAGRFIVWW